MIVRRIVRAAVFVAVAVVVFTVVDYAQGRESGLGFGRALALGAAQAAGWGVLAPGARALGRRFPMRRTRPAALLVHGAFAAAFALVKSAIDVGVAQTLVAGEPPAGPGFAGNAVAYALLAFEAGRQTQAVLPTTPATPR